MENFAYLCTNENNKKSMKKNTKTYLYYATEENCFEMEKGETTDIEKEVKELLANDYVQTDVADYNTYDLIARFNKDGVATMELESGQGYNIIIGVARHGKCSEISKRIAELRREAIAMCY